jgi:peptide/nickel transport system permease protein
MISDGLAFFDQWWISAFPGTAIFTIVMAFNFVGDGLRDALDPRLRRQI